MKGTLIMAKIENVQLSITVLTDNPDYCQIAYSYVLHPSGLDCAEKRRYAVSADFWGQDLIDDDVLAWGNDKHDVRFDDCDPSEPVKMERVFEIEKKALDEDLFGDDEVYLMVEASSGLGPDAAGEDPVFGRSNTVIGDF
jgi:hypothetical protein